MFGPKAPRVFDIPASRGFAEALAEGLLERAGGDPLALSNTRIYLSTRRAVRAVTEALIRAKGGPMLLPKVMTLADLDDPALAAALPPAVGSTERLLVLTRLVRAAAEHAPHLGPESAALGSAKTLAALLDQAHGEGLNLDRIGELAPENHAEHWAESLKFLDILRQAWPAWLAAEGKLDPVERRAKLIDAQLAAWAKHPPAGPVIVAGSTGSVGISARLIAAVAHLPQGAVILPGLDRHLNAETFAALRSDHPEHPQAGLSRLLALIGGPDGAFPRDDVGRWSQPPSKAQADRAALISLAMRPAPFTNEWQAARRTVEELAPTALAEVGLIEAEAPQDEAQAIALALRHALEANNRAAATLTPQPAYSAGGAVECEDGEAPARGFTAALITPDRTLARRVAAALGRWGIAADDSGGRPLHLTPPGVFLSLLLDEALTRDGPEHPERLLALLKHPIAALSRGRADHLRHVRRVEVKAMRQTRAPAGGDLDAIAAKFDVEDDADLLQWLDDLRDALLPLRELGGTETTLPTVIAALVTSAEALSMRTDETPEIWRESAGEAARTFLDGLAEAGDAYGTLDPLEAPSLIGGFMAGVSARAPFGQHPRLAILGTLEARMQRADVTVLAGLSETVWPKLPDPDPWMSRQMRAEFGLPDMERRIGLSAHDFEQGMSGPKVFLSRSRKIDGAPAVPSRWVQRLLTLLGGETGGFAPKTLAAMRARGDVYLTGADALAQQAVDALGEVTPAPRPNATPPLAARPGRLSVTDIETLVRDPYAIYAKRVLRLRALAALSPEPDDRTRGILLHEIVEQTVRAAISDWPDADSAAALYRDVTTRVLGEVAGWPATQAFYRVRAEKIARWFIASEEERRVMGAPRGLELGAKMIREIPGYGALELTAQADRVDIISGDGYAIYDYKTGKPPNQKQVAAGFAQQLPLQGALAEAGAFEGLDPLPVARLSYFHLSGKGEGGSEQRIKEAEDLVAKVLTDLDRLMTQYADEAHGFRSRTRPQHLSYAGDYDHLARLGEWGSGDDDG